MEKNLKHENTQPYIFLAQSDDIITVIQLLENVDLWAMRVKKANGMVLFRFVDI